MSITIDHELFEPESFGLHTVGQVLSHLQRDNRLVTNLLIDGEEPDLSQMGIVRRQTLNTHTLYIETADPRDMALEVLYEVELQLQEADRLKGDAIDLLQHNHVETALQKLSGCFSTWHHAQESVLKTAQLLRIDLERIRVEDRTLQQMVAEFTVQLRSIKSSLENRDYVLLTDILVYEATETNNRWRHALDAMRDAIGVVVKP
ncbi:MAG TPA: hypothetical protein VFE47_08410 [Tepidisphaeraceae bacterium]|jgi:hypothetical protein|nr:hypothetical protein [Tepidisphaeraceae bacterium]